MNEEANDKDEDFVNSEESNVHEILNEDANNDNEYKEMCACDMSLGHLQDVFGKII